MTGKRIYGLFTSSSNLLHVFYIRSLTSSAFASLLYFDQEFPRLQGFNQGRRLSSNMARAMDEPKARGGNKLNPKPKSIRMKK
jgi:hypothetical protein